MIPFEGLYSFSEVSRIWGLNGSTLRKALEYRKIIEDVDCRKFGRDWVITEKVMIREYGEPNIRVVIRIKTRS